MESQVLSAADFSDAAPAASTDSRPTSEADYPAWETGSGSRDSLTSEDAPSPDGEAARAASDDPTRDAIADYSAIGQTEPAAETESESAPDAKESPTPAPTPDEVAQLRAQLAQEQEWRERREQEERQQQAAVAMQQIEQEWAQYDARERETRSRLLAQARNLSDTDAARFLEHNFALLQQQRDNKWAEVVQARDTQMHVAFKHVAQQLFAQRVVKDFDLDPEAEQTLRRFDPEQLNDEQFHFIISSLQHQKANKRATVQSQREQAAQQRIASGADAMGGLRGGGGQVSSRFDPKSRDYDPVASYEVIGGWSRG